MCVQPADEVIAAALDVWSRGAVTSARAGLGGGLVHRQVLKDPSQRGNYHCYTTPPCLCTHLKDSSMETSHSSRTCQSWTCRWNALWCSTTLERALQSKARLPRLEPGWKQGVLPASHKPWRSTSSWGQKPVRTLLLGQRPGVGAV